MAEADSTRRRRLLDRYMLKVTPIGAKDLMLIGEGKLPSAYCTLVLLDRRGNELVDEKQKTAVRPQTRSPLWATYKAQLLREKEGASWKTPGLHLEAAVSMEEFLFGKAGDLGSAKTLVIKVKSESMRKAGDDLGRVFLDINNIDRSGTETVAWYKLQPTSRRDKVSGEIKLALCMKRLPGKKKLWTVASRIMQEVQRRPDKGYTSQQILDWMKQHGPKKPVCPGVSFASVDECHLYLQLMLKRGILEEFPQRLLGFGFRSYLRFTPQSSNRENAERAMRTMIASLSPDYPDSELEEDWDEVPTPASERRTPVEDLFTPASSGQSMASPEFGSSSSGGSRSSKHLQIDDFKLLKLLDQGTYGKLFLGRLRRTGQLFAIKAVSKINMAEEVRILFKKERDQMKAINHPFIASLQFAFQNDDKMYFGLEWLSGGDLRLHLSESPDHRLSDERTRFYVAETATALQYLHSKGIVYRDLRPENVLLDRDGHIRLADYRVNSDATSPEEKALAAAFSPYSSPELIAAAQTKDLGGVNQACDWWSLGIMMFEMLVGRTPFADINPQVILHNVKQGELHVPDYLAPEAIDLIKGLIERDLSARYGVDQVLRHPYFAELEWPHLVQKRISPPWAPDLASEEDVRYAPREYLSQTPTDTPEWRMLDSVDSRQEHIQGLTFVPDAYIAEASSAR